MTATAVWFLVGMFGIIATGPDKYTPHDLAMFSESPPYQTKEACEIDAKAGRAPHREGRPYAALCLPGWVFNNEDSK